MPSTREGKIEYSQNGLFNGKAKKSTIAPLLLGVCEFKDIENTNESGEKSIFFIEWSFIAAAA